MRVTKSLGNDKLNIQLQGGSVDEVDVLRYLGMAMSVYGSEKLGTVCQMSQCLSSKLKIAFRNLNSHSGLVI